MDLETLRIVGFKAAQAGAKALMERFGKFHTVRKKGVIDLVTEADMRAEQAIVEVLAAACPEHAILAEESGRQGGDPAAGQWVIDPLDGTTNYAHHLPVFAVSIAFRSEGRVLLGIVYNPATGERFTAVAGGGAFLNDTPIGVSQTADLGESLLATGFPYDIRERAEGVITVFTRFLKHSQGIRRLGSAALDLCYLACGRFDGYWELNLKPWDTAAGALIVTEAGGRVTDFTGAPYRIERDHILASNACIHDAMLALLSTDR